MLGVSLTSLLSARSRHICLPLHTGTDQMRRDRSARRHRPRRRTFTSMCVCVQPTQVQRRATPATDDRHFLRARVNQTCKQASKHLEDDSALNWTRVSRRASDPVTSVCGGSRAVSACRGRDVTAAARGARQSFSFSFSSSFASPCPPSARAVVGRRTPTQIRLPTAAPRTSRHWLSATVSHIGAPVYSCKRAAAWCGTRDSTLPAGRRTMPSMWRSAPRPPAPSGGGA